MSRENRRLGRETHVGGEFQSAPGSMSRENFAAFEQGELALHVSIRSRLDEPGEPDPPGASDAR